MERKYRVAAAADRAAVVGRSRRMSRVFDHGYAVTLGGCAKRGDIERRAREMDWNDELGSLGERRFDAIRSRHQCVDVDVDEHRRRAPEHDEIDRRNPRHRRRDHLVAGPDLERVEQQVHAGSCRGQRNRVTAIHRGRELRLELCAFAAGSDPAGFQDVGYGGDIRGADRWPR